MTYVALLVLSFGGPEHPDHVRPFLEAVISVDDMRLFKPAPAVYAHARRLSGAWTRPCWRWMMPDGSW